MPEGHIVVRESVGAQGTWSAEPTPFANDGSVAKQISADGDSVEAPMIELWLVEMGWIALSGIRGSIGGIRKRYGSFAFEAVFPEGEADAQKLSIVDVLRFDGKMTKPSDSKAQLIEKRASKRYNEVTISHKEVLAMPILWNIQVSRDTNRSVQLYLLRRGKVHESDLSQFVEQAVRSRLFELLVEEKKAATHGKGPTGGNNER